MSPAGALLVGLGGAAGAVVRYVTVLAFADRRYPVPTLVVNVLGSFLFGLTLALGAGDRTVLLVGVGFCGAFTTYSTFSVDTIRLFDEEPGQALAYAAGTLLACLLAVVLAVALGTLLVP